MRLLSPARTASLVAAGALAATTLAVATPAAQAAVLANPVTNVSTDFSGSGSCTMTGPGSTSVNGSPFAADGVPVTTTTSSSATFTHTVDTGDITTLTASSTNKITATQAGGALASVDIVETFQATANSTRGAAQQCDASANADAVNVFEFDLPSAKYLTVDIESSRTGGLMQLVSAAAADNPVQQLSITFAPHFHTNQRVYLPAGSYQLAYQAGTFANAPVSATSVTSRSGSLSLALDFHEPGIATTAAEGDGTKYLDLADGRTCSAASLSGEWKSKAGKGKNRKIKKAVFYVNDVKVKTVKKPKKKTTTTLTGLDPEKTADVEVRIKLAKKPKKGDRTVTVERSYLPCT